MEFDLVLCQYQLPDRTAFPLLDWLGGSHTTLFLSTAVESGNLWLPMLERGENCVGARLLRGSEFTDALSRVLRDDIGSGELRETWKEAGPELWPEGVTDLRTQNTVRAG